MRSLIRTGGGDLLKQYYTDFRDTHGSRPLALEAYEDGFNPPTVRNEYGSWFDFVATMGDLTPAEAEVRSHIGAFLGQLLGHAHDPELQDAGAPGHAGRRRLPRVTRP